MEANSPLRIEERDDIARELMQQVKTKVGFSTKCTRQIR